MSIELPAFGESRVLVAGDIMLDRFMSGDTQRVSPEAPVPVVHIHNTTDRAGGAGNVALNLAALGCRVSLAGLCGDDHDGDALVELLQKHRVDAHLDRSPEQPTIVKLRVLSRHQQLLRLDFEQRFSLDAADRLNHHAAQLLDKVQVLVLSDYNKGSLAACARLIKQASAAGVAVLVDPKGNDWSRYQGATGLTPNQSEIEQIVGPVRDLKDLEEKSRALMETLDLKSMLVTRGEHGMLVVPRDAAAVSLQTRARDVFDVTGAGDTVIATVAACLAAGSDLVSAAAIANSAAGIVVGKLGTATVTPAELRRAILHQPSDGRGVVDEAELLERVAAARDQGERIVMTNGCFDLLHAGHVAYLRELAAMGDRLIVAVNDDASVSRLKGSSRPVTGLSDRMAVLAGLDSVDWVLPFSEDTPARLIEAVLPDVLAKGGDYQPQDIAGYQAVTAAGGEVRVVAFLPGRSTSSLIDRIKAD